METDTAKIFTIWIPDPVGVILRTGYFRFESPLGVSGLAKVIGRELDILVVIAEQKGTGQFRRFIEDCKTRFDSISILEDWNWHVLKV